MTAEAPAPKPMKLAEMTVRQVANGYFIESEPRMMGMAISLDKIYVANSIEQTCAIIAQLLKGEIQ